MARIEELLEQLETILDDGKAKAFSGKTTVDADAIRTVIEDIRLAVPEEVKQAMMLASERREIMNRANKEAEDIIEDARVKSRDLLAAAEKRVRETDGDTTRRSEELLRDSQERAKNIIDTAKEEAAVLVAKETILAEAKATADNLVAQAEAIMLEAKEKAVLMIKEAQAGSEKLEAEAEQRAKAKMEAAAKWSYDLKTNASTYVDELVNETEFRLAKSLSEVQTLQNNLRAAAKVSQQAANRADRQRATKVAKGKAKANASAVKNEPATSLDD